MTTVETTAAGGFVRMPKAWLTLSISPQAKMLLMAFCGYADPKGRSWFSYEQLGEILNRSRGSIATYVSELRESGVISCKKQTYGNGYNYRLLITVKDWSGMVEAWSGMAEAKSKVIKNRSVDARSEVVKTRNVEATSKSTDVETAIQKTERSIQPAARKDPSGPITNIYKTQTPRPAARVVWSMKNEEDWHKFRPSDRDPVYSASKTPDPDLLRKVIKVSQVSLDTLGYGTASHIKARTTEMLGDFMDKRRISGSDEQISDTVKAISSVALTDAAIDAAFASLARVWQPHWRRISTPTQITKSIAEGVEAALPPKKSRDLAGRFMGRAFIAEHHIKRLEEQMSRRAA
jgi:hypothetical protein